MEMTDEQIKQMLLELLQEIDYDIYKDVLFDIKEGELDRFNRIMYIARLHINPRRDSAESSINNIR